MTFLYVGMAVKYFNLYLSMFCFLAIRVLSSDRDESFTNGKLVKRQAPIEHVFLMELSMVIRSIDGKRNFFALKGSYLDRNVFFGRKLPYFHFENADRGERHGKIPMRRTC